MSTKLVVLEDDVASVMLLKRYLKRAAWEPEFVHFEYGTDAVDYFKAETDSNAVFLMDLNLPDMHGTDVLKAVRGLPGYKEMPVVVLTTSNLEHEKKTCLELGVEHFLEKPYDFEDLIELVGSMDVTFSPAES